MTTVTLSLFAGAGAQFLDNSGNVLTGGLIYTYAAGTTTPLATYTSNLGTSAHPNPIILDASGRVPGGEIWLTTGLGYKFLLKDSNNVLLGTYDNVPSSAQPPIANDASSVAYEQGYTVTAGAFVVGSTYLISSIGTTNFQAIGAASNAVGVLFIATGVGSGTGTAKLSKTVQSKLQESVSVKDFGAIGDGATDNTNALLNLQTYLIANPGLTVLFPPGIYQYKNPYWLRGVQNTTILGYGATFQNILPGSSVPGGSDWVQDQSCLWINDVPFIVHGKTQLINEISIPGGSGFYTYGYLFNSASSGDSSFTLTNTGDQSNFNVGDTVLVAGYSQYQAVVGFPPNYRYWEVKVIQSIASGVITFTEALNNSYDASWRDVTNGIVGVYGKPRILSLNRNATNNYYSYIKNMRIYGVTFIANPNSPLAYPTEANICGLKNIELKDCVFNLRLVSDFCEQIQFDSSYIPEINELGDKLCNQVYFSNCELTGLFNFAGTNIAVFDKCVFKDGTFEICPDNLIVSNSQFYNTAGTQANELIGFESTNSMYSAVFRNNIFRNANKLFIGSGWEYTFTVASVLNSQNIIVTGFPSNVTDKLKRGYSIYTKNQNTSPSNTKIGKIYNVSVLGSDTIIQAEFNQLPIVGDVFYWKGVQVVDIDKSNVFLENQLQYDGPQNQIIDLIGPADIGIERKSVVFKDISLTRYLRIDGIPLRIIASVIKPYTGDTGVVGQTGIADLVFKFFQNNTQIAELGRLRANVAGTRIIELTSTLNAQAGDSLPAGGHLGVSISEFQLLLVNANSAQITEYSTSPLTAPHISVIVEYIPYRV